MLSLTNIIEERRAYRSLERMTITEDIIQDLAKTAQLSASCFNNQPWNFLFVYGRQPLDALKDALSQGNQWATKASMIIAVFTKKEDDCIVKGREYYLFDTGMATAFLILRATEMGMIAHPIAGFDESLAKSILHIPEEYLLITLIVIGKKSKTIDAQLKENQIEAEQNRPPRKSFGEFCHIDTYQGRS